MKDVTEKNKTKNGPNKKNQGFSAVCLWLDRWVWWRRRASLWRRPLEDSALLDWQYVLLPPDVEVDEGQSQSKHRAVGSVWTGQRLRARGRNISLWEGGDERRLFIISASTMTSGKCAHVLTSVCLLAAGCSDGRTDGRTRCLRRCFQICYSEVSTVKETEWFPKWGAAPLREPLSCWRRALKV